MKVAVTYEESETRAVLDGRRGRTDGRTDRLKHVKAEVTFFCILDARSQPARRPAARQSGRGSEQRGARGRDRGRWDITLTAGAAAFPISYSDCCVFPSFVRSRPPTYPHPHSSAAPVTFRLPQGICSPIGSRDRNRETDRENEGRPSVDPPAKGYS